MRNDKSKKILSIVKQMERLAYKLRLEDQDGGNALIALLYEIKQEAKPDDNKIIIYD
jgi:hypothetical protein